jgi:hypothetical protein
MNVIVHTHSLAHTPCPRISRVFLTESIATLLLFDFMLQALTEGNGATLSRGNKIDNTLIRDLLQW